MNCAETLKKIRQQCLLSQKDFADALGVSFSTVNRWENGKTVPNYKDLKKYLIIAERMIFHSKDKMKFWRVKSNEFYSY